MHRAALILFEGGLAAGLAARSGPCSARRSRSRCPARSSRRSSPGSPPRGCSGSRRSRACCSASIIASTDGAAVFSLLRGVAACAGGSSARWRARPASTTRSPCCSCSGSSTGSSTPTTASPDMALLFVAAARASGSWPGSRSAGSRCRPSCACGSRRRASTRSPRSTAATLAFGAADTLARLGLPRRLPVPASRSARPTCRRARTVIAFHEGLAWVAQLDDVPHARPARLPSTSSTTSLIEGTLLALSSCSSRARWPRRSPRSGWASTRREKALLGWAGLRGAVPVVLATFPVIEGIAAGAATSSTSSSSPCSSRRCCRARRSSRWRGGSGVTSDEPALPARSSRSAPCASSARDVVEHVVRPGDAAAGARLRELGLPRDALVSLIVRGEEALLPRGSTRLEAGDRLLVLVRREVARELPQLLERWRTGPVGTPVRPPRTYTGTRADLHVAARGRRPTAIRRTRRRSRGQRRRRAPAHAPRRARRARHPRRRPLRGHRPDPHGRPAGQVQAQVRRRLTRADDSAEQAWWQEVIGACAL